MTTLQEPEEVHECLPDERGHYPIGPRLRVWTR